MSKEIKMELKDSTVAKVDDLLKFTGSTNKTQIVATAIKVLHELHSMKSAKSGLLYVEFPDGTRRSFILS